MRHWGGRAAVKVRKGWRKGWLSCARHKPHWLTKMPKLWSCNKPSQKTHSLVLGAAVPQAIKGADSGTTLPGTESPICLFCKMSILVSSSQSFLHSGIHEMINVKQLEECLAHRKCYTCWYYHYQIHFLNSLHLFCVYIFSNYRYHEGTHLIYLAD